jgi:hypothetical protein
MGQAITVHPSINSVLVYKTKEDYQRINSFDVRLRLLRMAVEPYQPSVD